MSPDLNKVSIEALKIINFIKCNALNSRLFLILCKKMGSEHSHLLVHTEVRWLSCGRVLNRFDELTKEIELFLIQNKSNYISVVQNTGWIAKCIYLSDIFIITN